MSLLNFGDGDHGPASPRSKKPLKLILGIGALAGVIALGSTLAANINLNTGGAVEFGQGVAQATACDSNVTTSPVSSFAQPHVFGTVNIGRSDHLASEGESQIFINYGAGGPFNTGLVLSGTGIAPGTTITNAPNGGTWQYLPISKPLIGSVTSATLSSPGRFKLDGINFSDIDTSSSHCQGKLFTVSAYLNSEATPFNTYQIVQTGDSFVLLSSSPGILSQADSSSFTINFCNSNDPYYVLMPGPGQFGFCSPSASELTRVTIQTSDATCEQGGTCTVGNIGPGGGIVFYYDANGFSSVAACSPNCHYLEAAPTTGNSAWVDELMNWDSAVSSSLSYRGPNDKNDWYLPSNVELYQLGLANQIVKGLQNCGHVWWYQYWSSSEYQGAYRACLDDGTGAFGGFDHSGKSNSFFVRPVRAF